MSEHYMGILPDLPESLPGRVRVLEKRVEELTISCIMLSRILFSVAYNPSNVKFYDEKYEALMKIEDVLGEYGGEAGGNGLDLRGESE